MRYDFAPDDEKAKIPYLDNKLGIISKEEMSKVEYKITALKTMELLEKGIIQKMPLTLGSFCDIHKHLFEDLYPWAGEIRCVNLQKGYSNFYPFEHLPQGLSDIFNSLEKDKFLKGLSKEEFIELFAYYHNEFNVLHPFREGNGRVKRLFLTEVARRAGWDIDLDKLDPNVLKDADIKAFGVIQEGLAPNLAALKNLFAKSIKLYNKPLNIQKPKTIEQKINRILWIYDRERYNCWFQSNESYNSAENKVYKLIKTKDGRQKLIETLKYCKYGAKTQRCKSECDELIKKINTIELAKGQITNFNNLTDNDYEI